MITLERRLASEPRAVPAARRHVGQWLDETGVRTDRSSDVLAVTSELVTSGVLHGGQSHIDVRAWLIANDVYLEVVTVGQPVEEVTAEPVEDPDGGLRSLGIVARLSDGMAVREQAHQSGVCCRFDLHGA